MTTQRQSDPIGTMITLDRDERPSDKGLVFLTAIAEEYDGSFVDIEAVNEAWELRFFFATPPGETGDHAESFVERAEAYFDITDDFRKKD